MRVSDAMGKLGIDESEVASRRAFFELSDEDLARLASMREMAEASSHEVVEAFYELLLGHRETRRFFADEDAVRRVKSLQKAYFMGLFSGRCDLPYVEERLRVGIAHERIGLEPKWYIGAYRRYLEVLHAPIARHFGDHDAAQAALRSVTRVVSFDMSLAIDAYIGANADAIHRHQAAIRELSTPVIRVHDRILLLPIVGTVDSRRAEQIMETVLIRVTDDQAKVILIDIAGVAVVDTRVADHLIRTTAAVRLLGAETILTGISAQVARTIIQLGVDISSMHTKSRLADGIELALSLIGKSITSKATT